MIKHEKPDVVELLCAVLPFVFNAVRPCPSSRVSQWLILGFPRSSTSEVGERVACVEDKRACKKPCRQQGDAEPTQPGPENGSKWIR